MFNVVSIALIIPFLELIFYGDKSQINVVELSSNPDTWMAYFNYLMGAKIVELGKQTALIYFSIGIVIAFFFEEFGSLFSFLQPCLC